MLKQRLVGVTAGAKALGIATPTLRKWLRLGRLPHYRLGGRVLLDKADVKRFVNGGRVEAKR